MRTEDVVGSPPSPSVPSAAAPDTVREGFGWVRQADLPATPRSPPAPVRGAVRPLGPGAGEARPEPFEVAPAAESSFSIVAEEARRRPTPFRLRSRRRWECPWTWSRRSPSAWWPRSPEKVIREIAWEVIPDLAESLIKKEIDRLKAELQADVGTRPDEFPERSRLQRATAHRVRTQPPKERAVT